MFSHKIDERTEMRLIDRQHTAELFTLIDVNREHLRRWHPQLDLLRSVGDVEKTIAAWQRQTAATQAIFAGIWFKGRFCGMLNHLSVDWLNRCAVLSYWLDAAHQGKGIMTACCRAFLEHGFDTWKLNRFTIECATGNARSRGIPERLGFKLEGIVRGIELLHGEYADHAIYGLLRSEFVRKPSRNSEADSTKRENDVAAVETAAHAVSLA